MWAPTSVIVWSWATTAVGQTLQGIHRQTGPEVRFGPKTDLISMLIPGGSCFSPL